MIEEKKHSNALLWISVLLFTAEFAFIVGHYWFFGGHLGDSSLTISRFVGLQTWSSLLFCCYNVVIASMLFYWLLEKSKDTGFLWRFLMSAFIVTFLALSISPHMPDEGASSKVHCFFAGAMFVAMTLIGLYKLLKSKQKADTLVSFLFVAFGIFFIIVDMAKPDWFVQSILWYETGYLYAFFATLLFTNRLQEKAATE